MKKQQLFLILAIFSCAMIASELVGATATGSSARKTCLPSSSMKYKLDASTPDDPSKKHWSRRALNSVLQCVDSEEDAETMATRSIWDIVARRFRSTKVTKQNVVGVLTTTATTTKKKDDDQKTTTSSIQTPMDRLFRKPLFKKTKDTTEQDPTTILPPFVGRKRNRSSPEEEDNDFYSMNKKKLDESKIDAPVTFRRKHVLPSPKRMFHRIYIRFLC